MKITLSSFAILATLAVAAYGGRESAREQAGEIRDAQREAVRARAEAEHAAREARHQAARVRAELNRERREMIHQWRRDRRDFGPLF